MGKESGIDDLKSCGNYATGKNIVANPGEYLSYFS
jgi:hypothetical protein